MKTLSYEEAVRLYRKLVRSCRRDELSAEAALDTAGDLIDLAGDLRRRYGLRAGIQCVKKILDSESVSADTAAVAHYFAANAWAALRALRRSGPERWAWEQPESEHEIAHLRRAMAAEASLPDLRRCQVLTNLGNALDTRGRLIEALPYWEAAIAIDPGFVMAHGNRGGSLIRYARACYDGRHRILLLQAAHQALSAATETMDLQDPAIAHFQRTKLEIETRVSANLLKEEFSYDPGRRYSEDEARYRNWCARERLFLNDLNDILISDVVKADVLTLPSVTTSFDEGPSIIGFFNQLKQEFITARLFLYEGLTSTDLHFADRDVTLLDTLDYPSYSVGIERVKVSLRSAYSLFDKMAFFLNDYLTLGIAERHVSFRTLWYSGSGKNRKLRESMANSTNVFMQALFWLAKDFFEPGVGTVDVEPNARRLAEIRHELEHKYLKIHEMMVGVPHGRQPEPQWDKDRLAYSIARREFEGHARELLRRSRSALIYLALAVRQEELRRNGSGDASINVPIWVPLLNDESKL